MRGSSWMRYASILCGLLFATCATLVTNAALAAPLSAPVSRPKKIRVGIDLEALGVGYQIPLRGQQGLALFGAGLGRALLIDSSFSVAGGSYARMGNTPPVGFHVGGVVRDGRMVVGARFAVSVGGTKGGLDLDSSGEGPNLDYTLFTGELIPYVRWLFKKGRARPFVEVHAGIGGGAVWGRRPKNRAQESDRALALHMDTSSVPRGHIDSTESRRLAPVVGVGGGTMFFFSPSISIDIGVNFDYAMPFDYGGGWQPDSGNLVLNMTTGISAWF